MAVELVLLEKVDSLGDIGEVVKVAPGYARNYLLPQKLAAPVTEQALQRIEARKAKLQQEHEQRLESLRKLAEQLEKTSITIAVEANEQEKLYGSVTEQQVVEALAGNDLQIEREWVAIEEPIRELGVYSVEVNLAPEIKASLKVWVVRV